jgi:16S rRNA (cytosine1402-N4)-methyltransferase
VMVSAHVPVLAQEAVAALAISSDGVYVDATFGRGGHSRLILDRLGPGGRLIALDRDPDAMRAGSVLRDARLTLVQSAFSRLGAVLDGLGVARVDGILLDIGVSSPQLDDATRGFSFRFDAPLDMRMDPGSGMSAADWLETAAEGEISEVIRTYGEERFAKLRARLLRHGKRKPSAVPGSWRTSSRPRSNGASRDSTRRPAASRLYGFISTANWKN